MPGFLIPVTAKAKCFHAGKATIAPSQVRVLVAGQPVATMASKIVVAGCPFQVPVGAGTKPQPCVLVQWAMPSTRFLVGGQPAALLPPAQPVPAVCQSAEQIPQGPPVVPPAQARVVGA